MIVVMKEENVEVWNTNDFVRYYMRKWQEFHKEKPARFTNSVWPKYGPHIKRFMNRHKLKSPEYKAFVDWVFSTAKAEKRPFVNFLAIVDDRTWVLYQRLKNLSNPHARPPTETELHKLRKGCFSNSYLFPTQVSDNG